MRHRADRPDAVASRPVLRQLDEQLREAIARRDGLEGWDRAEASLEVDRLLERRHKYQRAEG